MKTLEEIALDKIREIARELPWLGAVFIIMFAALKIAYYNEGLMSVLRISAALFWLFVLPGYAFMLHWKEKLSLSERIIVGTAASAAVVGILSYYLGILGITVYSHVLLVPAAVIAVSVALHARKGT